MLIVALVLFIASSWAELHLSVTARSMMLITYATQSPCKHPGCPFGRSLLQRTRRSILTRTAAAFCRPAGAIVRLPTSSPSRLSAPAIPGIPTWPLSLVVLSCLPLLLLSTLLQLQLLVPILPSHLPLQCYGDFFIRSSGVMRSLSLLLPLLPLGHGFFFFVVYLPLKVSCKLCVHLLSVQICS